MMRVEAARPWGIKKRYIVAAGVALGAALRVLWPEWAGVVDAVLGVVGAS